MLTSTGPLRVAVLCSFRAPGLLHLLDGDPARGRRYEIVCCVTSDETFSEDVRVARRGVPVMSHPIRRFCKERFRPLGDPAVRAEYDERLALMVGAYRPDLILLSSYLYRLTVPMLDAFAGRIVNVHHADLTLTDGRGLPRYPGLRAVRDAILAGEPETRASAHIVTEVVDGGPLLLRSWPFPIHGATRFALERSAPELLRACVFAHQEWMIGATWGPMLAATLGLAADAAAAGLALEDLADSGHWDLDEGGALTHVAPAGMEVPA